MTSHYKIISESEGMMLAKKDNKFKLEINSKVEKSCNILKMIDNNTFFDLLTKINPDILKETRIELDENDKTNIYLILNELDEDEDEKLYISFTSKIKHIDTNDIIIIGKKNELRIDDPNYKKIEIDNLLINVKLVDNMLSIKLKILYTGKQLPIFSENMIGHMFKKIFKRLLQYYNQ